MKLLLKRRGKPLHLNVKLKQGFAILYSNPLNSEDPKLFASFFVLEFWGFFLFVCLFVLIVLTFPESEKPTDNE